MVDRRGVNRRAALRVLGALGLTGAGAGVGAGTAPAAPAAIPGHELAGNLLQPPIRIEAQATRFEPLAPE